MMMAYITAYGDNPPRWASPTTHAVVDGTGVRQGAGLRAIAACGRGVSHGTTAQPFDPADRRACKTCVRVVAARGEA
jgi:hypothetical protein